MANWPELLAHTARYSCGPFVLVPSGNVPGVRFKVVSTGSDGVPTVVALVCGVDGIGPLTNMEGIAAEDPVGLANAVLLKDAPCLLELVARIAYMLSADSESEDGWGNRVSKWAADARTVLTRHVRSGYEGEGAEKAAAVPTLSIDEFVARHGPRRKG